MATTRDHGAVSKRGDRRGGRGALCGLLCPVQTSLPFMGRLRLLPPQDAVAGDEEIGQCTGYDEPMAVLREPAVADLGKPEDPFDYPDWVLNLGADPRRPAVPCPLRAAQWAIAPGLPLGQVAGVWRAGPEDGALTRVGGIPPHAPLPPVQQPGQRVTVMDVSRRGHDRMDELALAVDPEVPFHPEVPLLPLLRLV